MNSFIRNRLEQEGYSNIHVSHGNILINFTNDEVLNYKELSKRINKSPQTMTTLIRTLEKEEFLTFRKDPKDKRNKLVSITDKGKEFIPVMMKISKELYDMQYKDLSSEEEVVVRSLLKRILQNFEGSF
jgi:DNA-binding MarR family transcriptional regulator